MADNSKDLISNEVLQKATQDILQAVVEHLYEFEPFDEKTIQECFDLSDIDAKSLSKVINDEYVAKNKVFSNEHTMELLSKTLAEANQYTTEQIANSGKLERKIVTSTSEVINENILYLILTDSTNNIYTQYMLIDGNATPLGTTEINLNDYLKTIDFNTAIDEYAKKNTVVLQNDVVGDLTTLSSNQVLSTQGVSDELDKKIDKTSIVTNIEDSNTNEQIVGAKTINDKLNSIIGNETLKTSSQIVTGSINELKDIVDTNNNDISNLKTKVSNNTSQLNDLTNNKADKKNSEFIGTMKLNNKDVSTSEIIDLSVLSFENGWKLFGDTSYNSKIVKEGNMVHLNVLIANDSPALSTTVFILPKSLRPLKSFITLSHHGVKNIETRIYTDGRLIFQSGEITPTAWININMTYSLK